MSEDVLDLSKLTQSLKITMEETWKQVQRFEEEKKDKAYYKEIKGKHGLIYPFDKKELRCVVWSPTIGHRIARSLGQNSRMSKGDEDIFSFPENLLGEVAKAIGAKYRRGMKPMTVEQREKQDLALAKWAERRAQKISLRS